MWSWHRGQGPSRAAFAVIKQGARTYEATIGLDGQRLVSWTERSGVQPAWLEEEFDETVHEEVKKHPDVIAALRRRGITDRTFVDCSGGPPGYLALPEQEGKRVAYVGCELPAGVRNVWARQIEGLIIVFAVNEKKVLQVIDEGVVPVPKTRADYDEASAGGFAAPAVMTLFLATVHALFGTYALSGAGVIPRLPLLIAAL